MTVHEVMQPGREMDIAVARAHGFDVREPSNEPHDDADLTKVCIISPYHQLGLMRYRLDRDMWALEKFHLSTNDATALEFVKWLCRDDRTPQPLYFKMTYGFDEEYGCWAYFDQKGWSDTHPLYKGHGKTIAEAICNAALEVARNESKDES